MDSSLATQIFYISVVFLLAGLVKGVAGLGLPTISMALLGLVMPPLQAAAIVIVPSLLTNVWQMLDGPDLYRLWLRLKPMMIAICAGTLLGSALFTAGDGQVLLGLALVLHALLSVSRWRWQVAPALEWWLGPVVGCATGILAAITGVFVLPAVPYLLALDLDEKSLPQALGMAFTVSTAALAVALAAHDAWQPAAAGLSFAAQLPALAGMLLGSRLRRCLQPRVFRRCVDVSLLALGVWVALSAC